MILKTDFDSLSPDLVLSIVEETLNIELIPFVQALPSYINRVYEIRDHSDTAFVVKFYRPGRWTRKAILDEHTFLYDCEESDIPIAAPIKNKEGKHLFTYEGIHFALFPRKAGRDFELYNEENWIRIGSLLARLHNVGVQRKATHRITLTPFNTTQQYCNELIDLIPKNLRDSFQSISARVIDTIAPHFESIDMQRIHGDFHMGNILHRPGEGILLIDFDDMMNGPAVQDFWLLLPDHYPASREQLQLLLLGYSDFREVNHQTALLIEGLRAMRMIYFTHWTAMQRADHSFQHQFPHWGSESFWEREISDLRMQFSYIQESLTEIF